MQTLQLTTPSETDFRPVTNDNDTLTFFQTRRLVFRRFEQSDLQALARISADVDVSRYVGDGQPLSEAVTQEWITNSRANVEHYGYGTGALLLRDTQQLIGWAGIARPAPGQEEVIYGFDKAHWGQGLGSELLTGLLNWAATNLQLNTLRATIHPDNDASRRMLEAHGFLLEDACFEGDPECHLYMR